ncbi:hypothetical protein [Actinoplanes philippinensis]|uniref:hypothetical protein n=1 Tax=Actinoplanes philippinensis TaxID=35752 RepID=UPI0033F707FA
MQRVDATVDLADDGSLLAVDEAMAGRVDRAVPHDSIGVGQPCAARADLGTGEAYQRHPVVRAQESSSGRPTAGKVASADAMAMMVRRGRRIAGKVASADAMAMMVRRSSAPAKTPAV